MQSKQGNQSELALIRKIQQGDKETFARIFRTHYTDLFYFIKRYVKYSEVCENLIQDLFLNIWISREEWHPKGSLRDYLFRAARNRAFDYLAHQKVERNYLAQQQIERESEWEIRRSSHQFSFTNDESAVNQEMSKAIQHGINQLPERRRLIFTMSWDEGLTYKEIADVLGISVKTVETQMGRALKYLRKCFSKHMVYK